jgi:hypothetical protein
MRAAYDDYELACALKPWLIRHLLEAENAVLYADSDLRFYAPLEGIGALIARHGLLLTRHLFGALPRDGRHPTEEDVLLAGTYNAGFLGVGRRALRFLDWWAERLETDCVTDPAAGLHVDQRWLDLAPGLVPDAHVLRDPGWNVGLWDLPNRPIAGVPGAWTAAGHRLRCFHFAGFDPERPDALSRHPSRADLAREPALARLCRDYAHELLVAGHGVEPARRMPFGTSLMRRLYREGRACGALREPLSTPAGEAELLAWLREPAARGAWAGLTRHLLALHAAVPHLRVTFPDLGGPDALAYAEWARSHAGAHPDLPAALAPRALTLPDGKPLDPFLLALFGARGAPMVEFLAWLREPAPDEPEAGVTRYLFELHRARPDLRAAFPAPGRELVEWARGAGALEHPLLGEPSYASSERAGAGSFV